MSNIKRETLLEKNVEFVVLGNDFVGYSLARIIHENYGYKTTMLCTRHLPETDGSKILDRIILPGLNKDDEFVSKMIEYAKNRPDKKLLLFPVSDRYTGLVVKHSDELRDYYLFNVPTLANIAAMQNKKDYYKTCDENNIPYPKSYSIKSLEDIDLEGLKLPVVVKYSDSEMARYVSFEGKEKVYIIRDKEKLIDVLTKLINSDYKGDVIIQDFIPGKVTDNYSLNAYCDSKGKVRMMALGQVLLDDVNPLKVGNNNALWTLGDQKIYDPFKRLLENIGYKGFANFDLKYDSRDGIFKTLECNTRFPASVFFIYCGGVNFVDFIIRDLLDLGFEEDTYFHFGSENVYLHCAKHCLKKFTDDEYKDKVKDLLKKGYKYNLWYEKDKSLKRWLLTVERNLRTIKEFYTYKRKNV